VLSLVYELAHGALDWGPTKKADRLEEMVSPERTTTTTIKRVGLDGRQPSVEAVA
jgi:NADH-quinone oxidoreductase subunit A